MCEDDHLLSSTTKSRQLSLNKPTTTLPTCENFDMLLSPTPDYCPWTSVFCSTALTRRQSKWMWCMSCALDKPLVLAAQTREPDAIIVEFLPHTLLIHLRCVGGAIAPTDDEVEGAGATQRSVLA